MPNYKPKAISHRTLARHMDNLQATVDGAIDALETATNRERVLNAGEAERRAEMAETYPALNKEHD